MNADSITEKKFFSQQNENDFRTLLSLTGDAAIRFLTASQQSVGVEAHPEQLANLFSSNEIPEKGQEFQDILTEAEENIIANSVRLSNPRFLGHMTGSVPMGIYLADFLVSVMNQNVVKIETARAASFVERQTLLWMHRLIYSRTEDHYKRAHLAVDLYLGNVTNGGTAGNITALAVARNRLLPTASQRGIVSAQREAGYERLIILASPRIHYSVRKAAMLLGLGTDNVVDIPVERHSNRVSLPHLERALKEAKDKHVGVVAIIGAAGSTETGSIDPLQEIADLASLYGVWFHVDAAWGGGLLLSERGRALLRGIERADSVVLDGHKLFYTTMNHGAVLFRSELALDSIRHSANYIIRPGSLDLGRTSIEGSRRFDSFKVWFLFKLLGRDGLAALVDRSLNLASEFTTLLGEHTCFEATSAHHTNILTYRFVPADWKPTVELLRSLRDTDQASPEHESLFTFLVDALNRINRELQKRQRAHGNSFVSRTQLESVDPRHNTVVLRVVLFNPQTQIDDLRALLAEQKRLGNEILEELISKTEICPPPAFFAFSGLPPTQPF